MASDFSFRLTQRANDDVDDILSYISVTLSNRATASAFMEQLESAIEEACRFPDSGSPVNNEYLDNMTVRKKLVGNYCMYYLTDASMKTVIVLRVVYARRNLEEILRQLGGN